ncbi:MAG: methyltransferase [Trebouxia sp. A1-2]|nr:MAG: methyltransferase [Trebouxia sp. A1-2]
MWTIVPIGPRRLKDIMKDEAEQLGKTPYGILQVKPVQLLITPTTNGTGLAESRQEAYVFVCYDSRTDGRARFTPHTAFQNPSTSPDAPPCKSIEIRALVFWENGTVDEKDVDPY